MEFENVDLNVKKKQGNVGVARAIYEYTKLGYTVLLPFTDSNKYDLVIDDGEQLFKVQVKTSRLKNKPKGSEKTRTGYSVQICTSGGNTRKHTRQLRADGDYDLLFILLETGECWSIPESAIQSRTTINVGATGPGSKFNEYKLNGA